MKDKKEVIRMTNNQTKALLKAVEIIVEMSETKEQAIERIREISEELKKESTEHLPQ